MSHRPTPGTQEFRQRVLDALNDPARGEYRGPARLDQGKWVSRNTIIYRGQVGPHRVVAKAQATKPPSVVVAEHRALLELEQRLNADRVRGLRPVTVIEDLGVLVTVEEPGPSLREVIEEALREPKNGLPFAVRSVDAAAGALVAFHDCYSPSPSDSRPAPPTETVRWYLDFGPKNILIDTSVTGARPEIVLIDAPEKERWGERWRDVGGFCFDVSRIRFLPAFVTRRGVSRILDHLKALFVRGYVGRLSGETPEDVLPRIRAGDRARASQALRWYLNPWRHRSPAREFVRLCYLGPLTAAYRARGSARSYQTVARLLQRDDAWWDHFMADPATVLSGNPG